MNKFRVSTRIIRLEEVRERRALLLFRLKLSVVENRTFRSEFYTEPSQDYPFWQF